MGEGSAVPSSNANKIGEGEAAKSSNAAAAGTNTAVGNDAAADTAGTGSNAATRGGQCIGRGYQWEMAA